MRLIIGKPSLKIIRDQQAKSIKQFLRECGPEKVGSYASLVQVVYMSLPLKRSIYVFLTKYKYFVIYI